MRRCILAAVTVLVSFSSARSGATADLPFRIVVNPQVKGAQIPRATLAMIFLRQAPRWGDGTLVVPVDQSVKSPVRSVFSSRVLHQQLMDVQIYWQRKMSAGVTPPMVRASDQEVIAFVAQNAGAIGYVSASAAVPETVRTIEITN